jgi:hypothetical protein
MAQQMATDPKTSPCMSSSQRHIILSATWIYCLHNRLHMQRPGGRCLVDPLHSCSALHCGLFHSVFPEVDVTELEYFCVAPYKGSQPVDTQET